MAAKKSKLPIKPLGGNILVKPEGQEETTPSGLVISANADKDKPQTGEVIALGTGKTDKDGKKTDWSVKVGDTVFFNQYSPKEIEMDDETYLIIDESDVLAVLDK